MADIHSAEAFDKSAALLNEAEGASDPDVVEKCERLARLWCELAETLAQGGR